MVRDDECKKMKIEVEITEKGSENLRKSVARLSASLILLTYQNYPQKFSSFYNST